jgi:hypothetical protein
MLQWMGDKPHICSFLGFWEKYKNVIIAVQSEESYWTNIYIIWGWKVELSELKPVVNAVTTVVTMLRICINFFHSLQFRIGTSLKSLTRSSAKPWRWNEGKMDDNKVVFCLFSYILSPSPFYPLPLPSSAKWTTIKYSSVYFRIHYPPLHLTSAIFIILQYIFSHEIWGFPDGIKLPYSGI